ncbi:uncharacterized protein PGTG_06619 [Puccinia graminis f. sp. tritici CRL 75-36-700-3]|uniref:Uncharacterized protein n=1 Tax=Puccinia graminis f. sp. tritici (strain CRL 75-36-700-3 / race SCCL) TaxID=418459 RepID=E3K8Y1_PUCGT|nr:uncharacterized protein PGTG_06619 [Puccinia graminis f. sp. tritici CRL 75-36-700-3]EFP80663.1 hypothetical protein PGTG_06619 [Puccinia graminis f. sp. tritici CRL 75-36-700-3]
MSQDIDTPTPTGEEQLTGQTPNVTETSIKSPTYSDHSNIIINQFLISPLAVHDQVNPRKPILAFDGSNYSLWQAAIDRTLRHISGKEGPFVSNLASFTVLPEPQSRSIEIVIRNTIDSNLLDIIDSRKIQGPKEICELLTQKCQPMDRRRKLNFVEQLMALMRRKSVVSEHWIVDWHKIYSELNQLNISRDELIGLLFQASLNLPEGIDPVTFDYLTNQRLEAHVNPSFDKVSTVLSTTLFDLRVNVDKKNANAHDDEQEKEAGDVSMDEDGSDSEVQEADSKGRRGSMCDYCQDEIWDEMSPDKENPSDLEDSDLEYVPPNRTQAADKADKTTPTDDLPAAAQVKPLPLNTLLAQSSRARPSQ